jgi:hypothetical protein
MAEAREGCDRNADDRQRQQAAGTDALLYQQPVKSIAQRISGHNKKPLGYRKQAALGKGCHIDGGQDTVPRQ